MTIRADGRKKSEFVAKDTVQAGGYLDYVVNGTNYKISYDNFVANLGVTGSIVQTGAVTGAPVLEIDGPVNRIRNMEDGSGISVNVSPTNGLVVAHNFAVNADGLPILLDQTSAQPTFASIIGGVGIAVTAVNGYGIEISSQEAAVYANLSMNSNATETVISSSATAVKVVGTFVVGEEAGFTGDTTGRITHNNDASRHIINAIVSVTVASGSNHEVSMYIAVNGTIQQQSKITTSVTAGIYRAMATYINTELDNGDYVEIFVRNESTTDNVIVLDAIIGAL